MCECGRAPARSSPPVRPPSLLSATPARTPIASTAPSSGRWTSACLRTPRTAKVRCVPCAGPMPRYSWLLPRGEAWLTGLPALPLGFSQAAWVSWVRGPHPGLCLPEGVGFGGPRPATWSWAAPGLMPSLSALQTTSMMTRTTRTWSPTPPIPGGLRVGRAGPQPGQRLGRGVGPRGWTEPSSWEWLSW